MTDSQQGTNAGKDHEDTPTRSCYWLWFVILPRFWCVVSHVVGGNMGITLQKVKLHHIYTHDAHRIYNKLGYVQFFFVQSTLGCTSNSGINTRTCCVINVDRCGSSTCKSSSICEVKSPFLLSSTI